jgi:hypothetical protein
LDDAVETAKKSMTQASEAVLNGYKLRTDVYKVIYPYRYMDERGEKMWGKLQQILSCIANSDSSSSHTILSQNDSR